MGTNEPARSDQPPGSGRTGGKPEVDKTIMAPKPGAPGSPGPAAQPPDRTIAGPPRSAAGERMERADATQASKDAKSDSASGPRSGAQEDPLLGTELGGCRIEALIGRGAMGAVYRARQVRLDRIVAVKIIRPDLLTDRRVLKRFEIEARTIGRFNSPHVVMIHDVGFERGMHFLVMEFVPGINLRDHARERPNGRIDSREGISWLRQACEGLKEAQRLQVLHRDIKPDNLMLGERSVLKIADFGIAKPVQDDFNMTMTAELMGTPLYMSPEQCRAVDDLDWRSDMFSLGATFYYLLTGEPPAKANSIYELIETKTKIEFLSLSKVLPEMDQDHPLTRIIAKMTALERSDRYQSYDEILRDLDLVAKGEEPMAEAPKVKPPRPKRRDEPEIVEKSSAWKWAVGALVLAGVAFGAWQLTRDPANTGQGGPVLPSRAQIVAQLERVRTEFRRTGPSTGLIDQLGAIQATEPDQQQQKQELGADLATAGAVRDRLAALPRPSAPRLPFTDIEAFYQDVDATARVEGQPRPELTAWLKEARSNARAENELRNAANAALMAEWAGWQTDRVNAGMDAEKLMPLGPRLKSVEDGRARLLVLFPGDAAALEHGLPAEKLLDARAGLAAPTVDGAELLARAREEFRRDGPSAALREKLSVIKVRDAAQANEREALVNEVGKAAVAQTTLSNVVAAHRPQPPEVPFTDIARFYQQIDDSLKVMADASEDGRAWAATSRSAARDEQALCKAASEALGSAWQDWQRQYAAAAGDTGKLETLQRRMGELKAGHDRLIALFPASAADLALVVPEPKLQQLGGEILAALGEQALLDQIAATEREVRAVDSLRAWQDASERIEKAAAGHATSLAGRSTGPAAKALERLNTAIARWHSGLSGAKDVAGKLAGGDLTGASSAARLAADAEGAPPEMRSLAEAAAKCSEAFAALRTDLDVAVARGKLTAAAGALKNLGALGKPAADQAQRWLDRLGDLERAAAGMAPIPAGQAATARGNVDVQAFFLARTEVSQKQFAAFLAEVKTACEQAQATTFALRTETINQRVGAGLLTKDIVQHMLDRSTRLNEPDLPVDNLSWFEAAAFARWYSLALPSDAEWMLAALGPAGNSHKFPWGDQWSIDRKDRNPSDRQFAKVEDGGQSWRTTPAGRLHHLAGNVAEWLDADPTTGKGQLAGGKYNDADADAKKYAEGRMRETGLDDFRPGYGLRTALRPPAFFGSAWPR
jgi:formylglycine-generating enzyme required for sulfatase activity/tRNA A-37 threonylcarbamoyl transferase component Bud32